MNADLLCYCDVLEGLIPRIGGCLKPQSLRGASGRFGVDLDRTPLISGIQIHPRGPDPSANAVKKMRTDFLNAIFPCWFYFSFLSVLQQVPRNQFIIVRGIGNDLHFRHFGIH